MTFFKKILGAAVVATLALSVVATSASAHNPQNYKGPGILPAVAGPIGAAAYVGTTSTTLTKSFHFWKWQSWGWKKVHYLKNAGWDVDITKKYYGKKIKVHADKTNKNNLKMGKAVVGCIFGSALGAITASVRKASALGNPPRWRSQAEHEKIVASGYEKQFELTNDEASTAIALCGLGSFALHWQQKAPAPMVVKARY
jgi:hypothetical protein